MLKFDTLMSGELLMIAGVDKSFVVLVTSLYEALLWSQANDPLMC